MSAAAAAAEAPPAPKGKKKLIIIIVAAVLALALAGGGAALMLKKKAHVEADADGEGGEQADQAPVKAVSKVDPKAVPAFVPLDPFTVNLADRDADRYAQIGITLEVEDAKLGDQIKNYMPAIRNNILMAIADRTAGELLGRDGKAQLAERVRRETARALGYELPGEEAAPAAADDEGDEDKKPKKKKKKPAKKPEVTLPIKAVHFSNFIIQ
jgi:flagellar protein FliL